MNGVNDNIFQALTSLIDNEGCGGQYKITKGMDWTHTVVRVLHKRVWVLRHDDYNTRIMQAFANGNIDVFTPLAEDDADVQNMWLHWAGVPWRVKHNGTEWVVCETHDTLAAAYFTDDNEAARPMVHFYANTTEGVI